MNKIKSFFVGCLLLLITFVMLVLVALLYRANTQSSVKTYIFQMSNFASQRVGDFQNINDIAPNELRNKLIKKYVAEYFKVIPGDPDVSNRPLLENLSSPNAFNQWENGEAKTIADMSAKKMFRMVRVYDDGIATINSEQVVGSTTRAYYAVRYYMSTWPESNIMEVQPNYEQGTIYIEVEFEPGIRDTINERRLNIRKYLESGRNPAGLFKFRVTNIGSKEDL